MRIIQTTNLRFDYFLEDTKVCGHVFFDKQKNKHVSRLEMIRDNKLVDVKELVMKLNDSNNDSIKEVARDIVKGINTYCQL